MKFYILSRLRELHTAIPWMEKKLHDASGLYLYCLIETIEIRWIHHLTGKRTLNMNPQKTNCNLVQVYCIYFLLHGHPFIGQRRQCN